MPLFPLCINLSDKKILIIGEEEKEIRKKVEILRNFSNNITIISKTKLHIKDVSIIQKDFKPENLRGEDLIVVTRNDNNFCEYIFSLCTQKKIFINCVDKPQYSNFIFPAIIKKGDLVIGITTSGKAPIISKKLKYLIKKILPENILNIVKECESIRKNTYLNKEKKKEILNKISKSLKLKC